MRADRGAGVACIALAIAFNLPYAVLASRFDYPDMLRRPAAEILSAVVARGDGLVLTWWAFGLCALAQVAVACALLTGRRGGAATAAAILGSLSGLTQAMGLWRWAFAVPGLANAWQAADAGGRSAIEAMFTMLHQYGGVTIGEQLGQWLTVGWIVMLTRAETRHVPARWLRTLGAAAALAIGIGTFEALSTVTALDAPLLALGAPLGYGLFTVWLIVIGLRRLRGVPMTSGAITLDNASAPARRRHGAAVSGGAL